MSSGKKKTVQIKNELSLKALMLEHEELQIYQKTNYSWENVSKTASKSLTFQILPHHIETLCLLAIILIWQNKSKYGQLQLHHWYQFKEMNCLKKGTMVHTFTTTHEQPTTFLAFPSESILQSCNNDITNQKYIKVQI